MRRVASFSDLEEELHETYRLHQKAGETDQWLTEWLLFNVDETDKDHPGFAAWFWQEPA